MTLTDKRMYRRLDLGIEDGYFGNFQLNGDVTIVAPIINLSAGGLNMAASDKDKEKIKTGDILLMTSIVGGTNLSFLNQIQAEIRWIKNSIWRAISPWDAALKGLKMRSASNFSNSLTQSATPGVNTTNSLANKN